MKKKITLIKMVAMAALLFAGTQVFMACKDNNEDPKPVPTILGFTPATAMEGASVMITGTHFSTVKSGNVVKFNGIVATVSDGTSSQLTVTVPAGTSTGKITVEVNSQLATSANDFVFIPTPTAPTITAINPATAAEGTVVEITGTHFNTTTSANLVKFNGMEATVTNATATHLTTTVPAGATTGKVTVTVGQETGGSADDFVVIVPTITSFTPATALAGSTITITGTNFGPASIVKFNNVAAVITNLTATQISATVPDNVTNGKITVQVGTKIATSATDFTLLILPTVTTFAPLSGAIGKEVILSGTLFDLTKSNNVVTFNGTPAIVTAASSTQLTTEVPYGATTGALKVTVNGTVLTYATEFTVVSSWTQKTSSFPGAARNSAFAFAVNGKGYVGGGYGTNWMNDFYEFDPTGAAGAGVWQPRASLPAGNIYSTASFVFNNVGGVVSDAGNVYAYASSSNLWSFINTVAVDNGTGGYATFFRIDNKLYVKNVDGTINSYDYNLTPAEVNNVASYPSGTSSSQAAFVIGSTAYVGGGLESFNTIVPLNSFYTFTAADGWKKLNNLPVAGVVSMFTVGETGYLKQNKTMYRYNRTNDSWTRLEDAPEAMQNSQASFVIGAKAYVGLSLPGSSGATQLWEFDPSK